jgi:predicted nucleotidyltransferase
MKLTENQKEKICKIAEKHQLKLVYLFGSQATGKTGPLSDYDFAVYLDEKEPKKRFDTRLKLIAEISEIFKTDKVDICVLNDIEGPELKYNIIKEGIVIFEKEPFKIIVEPRILNEYFDFYAGLKRYNLTKS